MNGERALSEIFTQVIICDRCGESLFEVAEMYKKDISIRCHKCGQKFKIFAEKENEAITENLLQQGQVWNQDQLKLSELLEIRLHSFELQIGYGEGAALLFETYVETLFDAVISSVDDAVLQKLQSLFFRKIRDKGMNEGPALIDDIETAAGEALRSADYELIDGETEN